jgi:membrane-bound lytic murein transglycosylase B
MAGLRRWAASVGPIAVGLVASSLQAGCAQNASESAVTPSTSVTRTAFAPDASGWSGQSGASGHPDMSADAIQAATANFNRCIESLYPAAAKRGVSRATFEAHTRGLTPELKIMDLMDAQPEFTKPVWEYIDLLVSEDRIRRGREILAEYRFAFDAAEATYGVDRHILAAIWGIESKYSTMGGERPVVRSTATLSCVGRRQNYFRNEFIAALELLERRDVRPEQLKGSWAGAFGPTQFMPTVYKNYAVDADGDGRRDMINSVPDMLASTANFFRRNGWEPGQSWGYEVVVPKNFDYMLADRSRQLTIAEWERLGIRRAGGRPFPRRSERAYLFVPAGSQGPGFLMLHNFRVIMRYNPAEAYALAIGHLADRLRGGEPFMQVWPRHERVLTLSERAEMQQLLAMRGFDPGEADGRFGAKTRAAIRNFQASAGLTPDGFATETVLLRLRGQSATAR